MPVLISILVSKEEMIAMMLSPETYYECNLKGKNANQIMREIDSLKKEIRELKETMERPDY